MALPNNGLFGVIAGKKSLPTIEVAAAHSRQYLAHDAPILCCPDRHFSLTRAGCSVVFIAVSIETRDR
jgi:hypothetical protein